MGWMVLVWILVIVAVGAMGFGAYNNLSSYRPTKKDKVLSYILIGLSVIVIGLGIFATTKLTDTESFKRFQKNLDSEFKGGITREITVHLENGDIVFQEEGKFDVEHSEERLKWVDESGKVQIIYLGRSSTAVVREK